MEEPAPKRTQKRRSVHLLGYDIADREWAQEQTRFQKVLESIPTAAAESTPRTAQRRGSLGTLLAREEHDAALRHALFSKLQTVDGSFSHHFEEKTLGFSLSMARYGDQGRFFLQVDATRPTCHLYPDVLKPHDELVAINDVLIVSADTGRFQEVLHLLTTTPRPVKLTFIEGEGRDLAFQQQERERRLAGRSPKKAPPPEAIPEAKLSRLTSAMNLDSLLSVAFIREAPPPAAAADEDAASSRVEARYASLPWCSVNCLGAAEFQVVEAADSGTLRYEL